MSLFSFLSCLRSPCSICSFWRNMVRNFGFLSIIFPTSFISLFTCDCLRIDFLIIRSAMLSSSSSSVPSFSRTRKVESVKNKVRFIGETCIFKDRFSLRIFLPLQIVDRFKVHSTYLQRKMWSPYVRAALSYRQFSFSRHRPWAFSELILPVFRLSVSHSQPVQSLQSLDVAVEHRLDGHPWPFPSFCLQN